MQLLGFIRQHHVPCAHEYTLPHGKPSSFSSPAAHWARLDKLFKLLLKFSAPDFYLPRQKTTLCVLYYTPQYIAIKHHHIVLNNKHFNNYNSSMLQFPKTIGHLKVITLNPRHDSY